MRLRETRGRRDLLERSESRQLRGALHVFGVRQVRRAGCRIKPRCKFLTVCNSYATGVNRLSMTPQTALPASEPRFLGGPFVCSAFFVGGLAAQSCDGASLLDAH